MKKAFVLLVGLTILIFFYAAEGSNLGHCSSFQEASNLLALRAAASIPKGDVVALAFCKEVPLEMHRALKEAFSQAGVRLSAEGEDLDLLLTTLDDFQKAIYEPCVRARLKKARWLVAVSGLLQGRALTLTVAVFDLEGQVGTISQGNVFSMTVSLREPIFMAEGTGYCNRHLPEYLWRYSALEAAELDARSRILQMLKAFSMEYEQIERGRKLTGDSLRLRGRVVGRFRFRRVSEAFDEDACMARVLLELSASAAQEEKDNYQEEP